MMDAETKSNLKHILLASGIIQKSITSCWIDEVSEAISHLGKQKHHLTGCVIVASYFLLVRE